MRKSKILIAWALGAICLTGCTKEKDKEIAIESVIDSEEFKELEKKKILEKGLSEYIEGEYPLYVGDILVVNKKYKVPDDIATELDSKVLEQFEKMKLDAKKDGLEINIRSGFRSKDTQKMLYENYVKRDGEEKANRYSAKPGHSEHQIGLAIDITTENRSKSIGDWFNDTPQAKWLYENAYKYGFILRYPNGKEEITGYKYESWHYRYVGTEHSRYFNQNNLTLEEYLGLN